MAGVALSDRGKCLAESSWYTRQNHTVELIPKLRCLLSQHGISVHDVKSIAVARGPGSFNGLRVGLATAKGLAFSLGIPIVGVSTLKAIAFGHAESGPPVCPIINAGRTEVAAALFETRNGHLRRIIEEHITPLDELCSQVAERTIFCGEINEEQSAQLEQSLGNLAIITDNETVETERVRCIAELGWRRIASNDYDDPITLQPLYLKKPSITKPKRRQNHAMSYVRPRGQ